MNLILNEKTLKKIREEIKDTRSTLSDFIAEIIFKWRDECRLSKIPKFKKELQTTINISPWPGEIGSIKEIQYKYYKKFKERLTYWQMIEAAWAWHCFKKEKKDG